MKHVSEDVRSFYHSGQDAVIALKHRIRKAVEAELDEHIDYEGLSAALHRVSARQVPGIIAATREQLCKIMRRDGGGDPHRLSFLQMLRRHAGRAGETELAALATAAWLLPGTMEGHLGPEVQDSIERILGHYIDEPVVTRRTRAECALAAAVLSISLGRLRPALLYTRRALGLCKGTRIRCCASRLRGKRPPVP